MEKASTYETCRKVLLMVSELHVRGYQRLRIVPGMAPSGCYWRCTITPATNMSGAIGTAMPGKAPVANYSSADGNAYFGWQDAAFLAPSRLAARFIKRFPAVVSAGRGSDWLYSGWYQEMLGLTYPDLLPIAFADWDLPKHGMATVGDRHGVILPSPPSFP